MIYILYKGVVFMKRILSLILVVVVLIGMIACSKDAAESEDKENSNLNDMNNKNDIVYTDNEVLFYCQDRCDNDDDSTYLYCYNYKGKLMSNDIAKAVGFLAPNGLAVAMDPQTEKYGFVDENGVFVIEPVFEGATGFCSNGLASVVFNGKYGYINSNGGVVIPFEYDYAERFTDYNCAVVGESDKEGESYQDYDYGLINDSNEIVVPLEYKRLLQFNEFIIACKSEDSYWNNSFDGVVDIYNYNGEKIESYNDEMYYYVFERNSFYRKKTTDIETCEIYIDGQFKNYLDLYDISSKYVATTDSGVAYGVEKEGGFLFRLNMMLFIMTQAII